MMNFEESTTGEERVPGPPPGLDMKGIYYVLFRHKWKIISLSLTGMMGAVAMYFLNPPAFQSEAKLLVRYVRETEGKFLTSGSKDSEIKSADSGGGMSIINTERELLTSFDLALQVTDLVGAEKILGKAGGATNRILAASVIEKNLMVETRKDNNTIHVLFRHSDPTILQPVLRNLIDGYQKKHVAVYLLAGLDDEDLTRKADELKGKLAKVEEELRDWKDKAGVTSVVDANRAHIDEISKIRESLYRAEAELAGRGAGLEKLLGTAPKKSEAAAGQTNAPGPVPDETMSQYRNIGTELDSLRKSETIMLSQFTGESHYVKNIRERIGGFEKQRKDLEAAFPQLVKSVSPVPGTANPAVAGMDPTMESYRITALEAETNTLHAQLDTVLAEAGEVKKAEAKITELTREKDLLDAHYRNYQTTLEQAKIYRALGPGNVPNINVVQEPTPPAKDMSKVLKPVGIVAALGVLGALALAFFIELVLDRSVKRPADVQKKLRLPLFLTIPRAGCLRNGHARRSLRGAVPELVEGAPDESAPAKGLQSVADSVRTGAGQVAPWESRHGLRSYYEALRDRLITHFEVHNMTHKPKLIGVTSCSRGAGVTSTAAGLAATLSETGDGNVLLVDMNVEQGAAHPFHMGKPACGLLDALELERRDPALVEQKLYLASMNNAADKLPRVLPRRFTHLVPKLKMSDYDYIIFDMPTITQTSMTPKLAAFMDMVLMVIESEKTNRDVVDQANSLLGESNVRVKAVLNKYRPHVPRWLQQEL